MRSPWEQVKTVRVMATASFFMPDTFPMPSPPHAPFNHSEAQDAQDPYGDLPQWDTPKEPS